LRADASDKGGEATQEKIDQFG
jgi:hypothetical protein